MNVLAGSFSELSDPREDGKVIYPLTDILVIAVCAAIAGAESYEDIVLYGESSPKPRETFQLRFVLLIVCLADAIIPCASLVLF